jgi:outer membrane murein-binding lipoprotein Lpp
MMIKTRPMMLALGALAALGLAGCASDSASMEKESTDYIVTGLGDDRQEALEEAKERALEQCEAQDRDEFIIEEQQVLGPNTSPEKRERAEAMVEGGTVNEDTNLAALNDDSEGFKAIWSISCR